MRNRILLYSTLGWPSAARYAGGFQIAGCAVEAICPKGSAAWASRYVETAHPYSPFRPLATLMRTIARFLPDLIVACDERAVFHLLRLYESEKNKDAASPVAALIARSLGRPENYGRVISRHGSLEEMRARGVRVPDTYPVDSGAALDACLAEIGLPAVLKVDGSWGGEGVIVARTREAAHAAFRKLSSPPSRLRSFVRAFKRRDAHFLLSALKPEAGTVCVQRFIPGRSAASAFAAKDGEIIAMFHYDVILADGAIGPPNVVRRVDSAEMDAAAEAAASCFGLSGLHGLDFIRDEAGVPYLIEINARPTQGGTLPFGEGRDLPAALAQTLSLAPVTLRPAVPNDVVTFFPREWRRDPSSVYIREGYHDVPWDDPDVFRVVQGLPPLKPRKTHSAIAQSEDVFAKTIAPVSCLQR